MDEYNLTWKEKDLLDAIIDAESGFNTTASHRDTNGTTDYGLVQMNDKYWIGEGKYFSSIEEVENSPEKSIRFLVESYQTGHLSRWSTYNDGTYLRFL